MHKVMTFVLTLLSLSVFGQTNPTDEAQPIVTEGKLLYKSEMASWYGTDLFLELHKDREDIGGYFSYLDNGIAKCIFFSKAENPKVIGTISFDSTYNIKKAKTDLIERDFTKVENDLFQIRKITLNELNKNTDGLFKFYQNTNPNIIPLINGKEKKVYILTGAQKSGVVIFGNDYLLTFNKNNKLQTKKQLHKNIITFEYGGADEGKDGDAIHNHLPETGDFITATDICTLMLYEKFAKWKTHNVVSNKYLNIWNCENDELFVIRIKDWEKINKDLETQKKESDK